MTQQANDAIRRQQAQQQSDSAPIFTSAFAQARETR